LGRSGNEVLMELQEPPCEAPAREQERERGGRARHGEPAEGRVRISIHQQARGDVQRHANLEGDCREVKQSLRRTERWRTPSTSTSTDAGRSRSTMANNIRRGGLLGVGGGESARSPRSRSDPSTTGRPSSSSVFVFATNAKSVARSTTPPRRRRS